MLWPPRNIRNLRWIGLLGLAFVGRTAAQASQGIDSAEHVQDIAPEARDAGVAQAVERAAPAPPAESAAQLDGGLTQPQAPTLSAAPPATVASNTSVPEIVAAALAPEAATSPDEPMLVIGVRPISAASSFSVRDRDFALRPIGSVQDILRVTPGLVMVQHSGGGKANQYFLRGFDADHGTDLSLSLDGVPINLVSHAHGQGFSDTNFIIPEVIKRVQVTKGPYFASQGDFATAGAVNLVSRDAFEQSSAGFGFGGSPGHGGPSYRGLLIASPQFGTSRATFAAEVSRTDGPFDQPDGWDKYKLFNKLTLVVAPRASLQLGEMSYGANWNGSGQIPTRAVDDGLISRFGALDRDEGGNTARHQLYVHYHLRPSAESDFAALAYVVAYRFNMFSDFTYFLRDPEHGDEIEQVDRRTFYGSRLSYRVVHRLSEVRFDTSIGANVRSDDIHAKLLETENRMELNSVRDDAVHETLGGLFLNEEVTPLDWLRVNVGGRFDLLTFAVDDHLSSSDPAESHSGVGAAHQLSPKASLIVTPVQAEQAQLDVYVNYGHGFHSNDVRGALAQPPVTPLTRAVGEELGTRARLWDRWDVAAALFRLDLDNETVWIGDEGTTEVGEATTRQGIEFETRYALTSWLEADLDLTLTRSAFQKNAGNGNGLALAPRQTWAGGLSVRHPLGPGTARGGLRVYGIGDRPASDDGVITAPGFTQVDLHIGYRHRRVDVAFDIENLLDGGFRAAQFDTVSRLQVEPSIGATVPAGFSCGNNSRLANTPAGNAPGAMFYGCEGVNFTPAYPLTLRLMATLFLD